MSIDEIGAIQVTAGHFTIMHFIPTHIFRHSQIVKSENGMVDAIIIIMNTISVYGKRITYFTCEKNQIGCIIHTKWMTWRAVNK